MRRLAALFFLPVLFLAACGDSISDDDEDAAAEDEDDAAAEEPEAPQRAEEPAPDDDLLDGIEVTGEFGEAPEVNFDTPLEADQTVRRVLSEGDGEPAAYDTDFGVEMVALDAETGDELQGFDMGMMPLVPMSEMNTPEAMGAAFLDVPLGSRVVGVLDLSADIPEGQEDAEGVYSTVVFVADLHAPGELELDNPPPDDLPQVTLSNMGEAPEVDVPDVDPPSDLTELVLVEGDGEEVASGDMLQLSYRGVLWADGEEFDSSYATGAPTELPVSVDPTTGAQMVEGWSEGLTGQKVGSTVLLVVPPELGYGEDGNEPAGISGDDTLIFVVEIFGAVDPEEAAAGMPDGVELPDEPPVAEE